MLRYRCHVGHAYSAEALSDGQSPGNCCSVAEKGDIREAVLQGDD